MNNVTEQILHDVQELPVDMQAETLDFVQFLKLKLERNLESKKTADLNKNAISELFKAGSKENLFSKIDDPATWQSKIRKDRSIVGR